MFAAAPVNFAIIALTCLISFAAFSNPRLIERFVLWPPAIRRQHQYDRLLTSGFVHADVGHLVFNLITYYSFAFGLQRAIGDVRFTVLYFFGLLVSNIGTCIKHRNEPNYASLGASGAILAVLFASIVYFPHQRLVILPLPIPIPAPLFAIAYLAFSYYSSGRAKDRINHDAHIFGALAGLAFVLVTAPERFRDLLHAF